MKRGNDTSYTEKYQDHILYSLLIKLYVLMIILVNELLFTEVKMQSINLLDQFLKSMIIAKNNE